MYPGRVLFLDNTIYFLFEDGIKPGPLQQESIGSQLKTVASELSAPIGRLWSGIIVLELTSSRGGCDQEERSNITRLGFDERHLR
jgi:hypothetical protein